MLLSLTAPLTAGTILGDPADHTIRSDGFVTGLEGSSLIVGGAGSTPALDRSTIFVFQLPDLGTGPTPFTTVSFTFSLSGFTNTPSANADLYGLGRRDSSDPQPGDFYGETTTPDPSNATFIQDNILVPGSPTGLKTTNSPANSILRDYLNAAYNSGEGIGKFVFLRLSTDAPPNGVKRYFVTSAEGGTEGSAGTWPRITYNEEAPPPASPRPFIWVRDTDRDAILDKIANQSWASEVFEAMVARVSGELADHQADRDDYLRGLPIRWDMRENGDKPQFKAIGINGVTESQVRGPTQDYFETAQDCAVLYYLTGDENYARCAADILHNSVQAFQELPPSNSVSNGGWLFQSDYLKEVRVTGPQLPITYDFLHDYLLAGNLVYDVDTGNMTSFSTTDAQYVFRTLYQLARDHGNKNSNWSSLMATTMVHSLLALDDPAERENALQVYLVTGSSRQGSLKNDARNYERPGDIWPESLQYAAGVGNNSAYLMTLVDRYDPSLTLFDTYPNIPLSLSRASYLRYPNDEQISFGDGHRETGGQPFFSYETVYRLASDQGRTDLTDLYGALINGGIAAGEYDRSKLASYSSLGRQDSPHQLLWFSPTIDEDPAGLVFPRTDTLPFAGIALQRNLPAEDPHEFGMMAFVGGASFVHSHASGMNMELYGAGQVLGAKSGRTSYGSTINENYYRVFASNNTVIVNGSSRGQGGWKDLGMNTVQVASMEPASGRSAVSTDISFTCSTFNDNRGSGAEAQQQRTLALVRTSPTTGYYVDIFRSDSSLANEFHDYIYRNVADTLDLESNDAALPLSSQPSRFQNDIGDAKEQPGWRYFEDVVVGSTGDSVAARFTADSLPGGSTRMDLHIPGNPGREYSRVTSPQIVDAPGIYDNNRAPTLVIRQDGEAWAQPFAVVFEPYRERTGGSIVNVGKLVDAGVMVGLSVESEVDGQTVQQYILSNPDANGSYSNPTLGISFSGRFAVITDHGDLNRTIYIGEGSNLTYQGIQVRSPSGLNTQANIVLSPDNPPEVTANSNIEVTEVAQVISILADEADTEVQRTNSDPAFAITNPSATTLIPGTSGGGSAPFKERCSVIPFQLPDFGPVSNPFDSANLAFGFTGTQGTPIGNLDLYGLGRRQTPTVLTSDYWSTTDTRDPSDATLLQDNILSTAIPLGLVSSNDLAAFLNTQYANGAGAGEFVFLRLSTDTPQTGGATRFIISSSDGVVRPTITYTSDVVFTPGQIWQQQEFGSDWSNPVVSGEMSDPEKDGIVNLLERALGGDPNLSDRGILPQGVLVAGRLALSFDYFPANTDLSIIVQASNSLDDNWTDLAQSVGGAPFAALVSGVEINESDTGSSRGVKVTDQFLTSDPDHPRRFMRVLTLSDAE